MAQLDLMANSLAGSFEMLKTHLADFSEADMLVRPVPGANHAAWQIGHLVVFEAMLCGMYAPQTTIQLPADAQTTYGKDGASSDDASRFFKKEEGLALLGKAHAALVGWVKGLTEADLAKPGPEPFKGWVNTLGELVLAVPNHMTMHIGQFQVIRRKLGKKIIF